MDYNNRFRILWYVPGPWILIWPLVCSLCYLQSKLYSYSVDVGKVTPDRDLNAQGHLEVYARRKDCWVILWINISLSDNNIIKKYDYFILVSYRLCCTTKCIFLKRRPFSKSLNLIFSHYFTSLVFFFNREKAVVSFGGTPVCPPVIPFHMPIANIPQPFIS